MTVVTDLVHHQMFIDGESVDSDASYELVSPATGTVICTMAKGSVEHADRAVQAARDAFERGDWSTRLPEERAAVLRRIAERINTDSDEFTDAEIGPNGATIRQATGFHVGLASQHFFHFADAAERYDYEQAVPTPSWPTHSVNTIRREPIGVCVAILPWNFPLILGLWKIAAALAAGNSIVVKPDEKTPLSLLLLAQVAFEEGVPAGVFSVVTGDGPEVGARLVSHPDVDKVAFTGSTAVGREIMRLASGTVKKVSLELGGKGPALLVDDADLDVAVDGIIFGCMLYSGQMCESGTRLLVPRELHDEVVARLVERARTIKLGDPLDYDTDMGPVISAEQQQKIVGMLERAREEGAVFALGGGVPHVEGFEDGYWIEPTIVTNVTNDMEIAREEVFGPVLSVLTYDSLDEAIAMANDSQYGLSAGVWGGDLEVASDIANKLRAGTVWINNWHQVDPALPFGGYKQSGLGREIGNNALDEYTEVKHVHLDLTRTTDRHIFDIVLSTPAGE